MTSGPGFAVRFGGANSRFWGGFGDWAALDTVPGNYFNATQNTLFYTPDLSRPAYTDTWNYSYDVRLDWQATHKKD